VIARRAVLFDIGGAVDLEFAWEMAVDGAIAAACGMEGIRVDPQMVEEASDRAVEVFAGDTYAHMIDDLCGGEPVTVARVTGRVQAMTGALDAFQLRPGIDTLLRKLRELRIPLVALNLKAERPELAGLFGGDASVDLEDCVLVGDRLDKDIAPAKAKGMATIQFRSGRWRRQRSRHAAEQPDVVVTDVPELEAELLRLLGR
jgi:beta-phosphoglucomutase-like phosphatase (HAD superfamily)